MAWRKTKKRPRSCLVDPPKRIALPGLEGREGRERKSSSEGSSRGTRSEVFCFFFFLSSKKHFLSLSRKEGGVRPHANPAQTTGLSEHSFRLPTCFPLSLCLSVWCFFLGFPYLSISSWATMRLMSRGSLRFLHLFFSPWENPPPPAPPRSPRSPLSALSPPPFFSLLLSL